VVHSLLPPNCTTKQELRTRERCTIVLYKSVNLQCQELEAVFFLPKTRFSFQTLKVRIKTLQDKQQMPSHPGGSRRRAVEAQSSHRSVLGESAVRSTSKPPPITTGLETVDPFCCKNPLNKVEKQLANGQPHCTDLLAFIEAARAKDLVLQSKLAEPGRQEISILQRQQSYSSLKSET
jgi:hypothetical protein